MGSDKRFQAPIPGTQRRLVASAGYIKIRPALRANHLCFLVHLPYSGIYSSPSIILPSPSPGAQYRPAPGSRVRIENMEDPFLPRRYACAGPSCTTVGNHTCQRCLLVKVRPQRNRHVHDADLIVTVTRPLTRITAQYCGRDCQKAHWPKHKEDCNHPMMKTHWRPRWELRNEIPSLGIYGWPVRSSETGKFLWGNIPAYDLLQLDGNEGSGLGQDLSLLLAGMSQLRLHRSLGSDRKGSNHLFQHPVI